MKKFLLTLLILVAAAGSLAAYRWKPTQWKDVFVMPFHKDEKSAEVSLKKGESLRTFAAAMQEKGIIVDCRNFLYWLTKKGVDRTLKAGSYKVTSGPSWCVVDQLKSAAPTYFSAIIIPGALPQMPFPFGTPEEQKAALSDLNNFPVPLRAVLPEEPESRAAFLLPETYSLVENSLAELTHQASTAWYDRFGKLASDDKSIMRAAVIASLLQREAFKDEEYPTIAGVIENRLRKNMLLQIDASVVYAWYLQKGETLKRVLYRHLEIDSPYNTYKQAGLPLAPICVPSVGAWNGAFNPQRHDYLYYVASGDGTHKFAKTQEEHEKNVREYHSKK